MVRESRRRYYGQVSHIDYTLGRFLGELRTRGLYDDTVIIFTSDHGEHLGDHGLWGKSTYLHGSVDVPLIMRLPDRVGITRPNLEINTPVLSADICPTLLELAGLEPTIDVDGMSLLPLLRNGQGEERVVCGEYGQTENATTFASDGRFKYIYYSKGGVEQLFDLENDSANLHDMAGNPDHQPIKDTLRQHLIH